MWCLIVVVGAGVATIQVVRIVAYAGPQGATPGAAAAVLAVELGVAAGLLVCTEAGGSVVVAFVVVVEGIVVAVTGAAPCDCWVEEAVAAGIVAVAVAVGEQTAVGQYCTFVGVPEAETVARLGGPAFACIHVPPVVRMCPGVVGVVVAPLAHCQHQVSFQGRPLPGWRC